jgi:hypothetical protein
VSRARVATAPYRAPRGKPKARRRKR